MIFLSLPWPAKIYVKLNLHKSSIMLSQGVNVNN